MLADESLSPLMAHNKSAQIFGREPQCQKASNLIYFQNEVSQELPRSLGQILTLINEEVVKTHVYDKLVKKINDIYTN